MDWTRGKIIGRGSTATVSIASDNHSGHIFAVKSSELSQADSLIREQRILSTLSCPQLVAYKGCDISSENGKLLYNLFIEYAPHGTVTDVIQNQGGRLDECTVRSYTRQILSGLNFLHSNGIVHCDIKGRNILVNDDDKVVKIADLGCAKRADDGAKISGTPVYMAPEVARGEQQGFPADVWALGCTVVEMVTGRPPWADIGDDPLSALYRIGFSRESPDIPCDISDHGKDFLRKCFKIDPNERWSANELLGHDFVNELKFEVKETNVETPTSVLCKKLWDTNEEFEEPCLSEKCLMRRIQLLVEDDVLSLKMPDWDCDENWVTVRSKSDENWVTVRSKSDDNVDESMRHDYDLGVDYCHLLEISGENASNINSSNVESRCKTSSLMMACKYATCMILCIKFNYSNNIYYGNAFFTAPNSFFQGRYRINGDICNQQRFKKNVFTVQNITCSGKNRRPNYSSKPVVAWIGLSHMKGVGAR